MKKIFIVVLVFAIFINFSSCEKDDICVDGDTPLLIIGFYDITDTTFKPVPALRIRSLDNQSLLNDNVAFGFTDRLTATDSIFIPLRINDTTTSYEFTINSAGDDAMMEETGNTNNLSFTYNLGEQFVSRACGFVANYNELDTIRTVAADDWIRGINILDNSVTNNPRTIHVQIFH